jgi:hypothetical protein
MGEIIDNWTENTDNADNSENSGDTENKNPSADDYLISVNYTPDDKTEVGEQDGKDIVLTVIEEKPAPPELPETAFIWEEDEEVTPEDVQAYEELDPALKNPNVKPNITPEPVQTEKPNNNAPASGTINEKNEMYVPGLGWVPYGGAPNEVKQSGPGEENWDWSQIGNMG